MDIIVQTEKDFQTILQEAKEEWKEAGYHVREHFFAEARVFSYRQLPIDHDMADFGWQEEGLNFVVDPKGTTFWFGLKDTPFNQLITGGLCAK